MSAFELRTTHRQGQRAARAVQDRLSGLGKAISDLVASIVRGLMPAPALQPIPVRVRARRQPRI